MQWQDIKIPSIGPEFFCFEAIDEDLAGVVLGLHHMQFIDLEGDSFALSFASHLCGELAALKLWVRLNFRQIW